MPAPVPIEVTASQQRELKRIVNAKTSSQRDVFRARIILGLAKGLSHEEIAKEQSVSLLAIGRWRKRWAAKALEGLRDAPGRGRKPRLAAKAVGRDEITAQVIRPGSFRSVGALVADIFRFLDHHNLNPKPYR